MSALSLSDLISFQVVYSAVPVQAQSLSNIFIGGSTLIPGTNAPIIDVVSRKRDYSSLNAIATDFGTTAPEYLAASIWFAQSPQPTQVSIGSWAKASTSAQLIGSVLTPTNSLLGTWTAITNGGFTISIDGSPQNVNSLNFSAATNLAYVASTISGVLVGAICIYNNVYNQFEFVSVATGTSATLSFTTSPISGQDISTLLGTSQASGAYVANGINAETALQAALIYDNQFGQDWFGIYIAGATDFDNIQIAEYIEGATNSHATAVPNQDTATLLLNDTTNVSYELQQLKLNTAWSQYSLTSPYAIISLFARLLTTNLSGTNTCISTMWKTEPNIIPEALSTSQVNNLQTYNTNVYANVATGSGNTPILLSGKAASGQWIDTVYYATAFKVLCQAAIFNLFYTTGTKIAQTDSGTHQVVAVVTQICQQFVTNGFIAPSGYWNGGTVGPWTNGSFLPNGFAIYALPVAQQNLADRSARKLVPIQIALLINGAVNTVSAISYISI